MEKRKSVSYLKKYPEPKYERNAKREKETGYSKSKALSKAKGGKKN